VDLDAWSWSWSRDPCVKVLVLISRSDVKVLQVKVKVGFLYSAAHAMAIQMYALTFNWTRVTQLANTLPLLTTTRPSSRKHSPDGATNQS